MANEAEFYNVIGTKDFLLAIRSHLYSRILLPPHTPLSKGGLKLVCNVNTVTETFSLRTLKVVPRNLNESVRSWIRLQESCSGRLVASTTIVLCAQYHLLTSLVKNTQHCLYLCKIPLLRCSLWVRETWTEKTFCCRPTLRFRRTMRRVYSTVVGPLSMMW